MTISEHWRSSFAPVDRRPIYEWAREALDLPSSYSIQGPPDFDISNHLKAPLDALQDDTVREVNVLAPVRAGKSLISDTWCASIVARTPGNTRVCFQNKDAAKSHAESRALKAIRSMKDFARFQPANPDKDRVMQIIFPSMQLVFDGASVGQLQARGYQNVVCDEIHLYKAGMLHEAKGRLGDFVKQGISKLLCLSQGSDEGTDWHLQFQAGVINEWHIQCQGCGHYMLPAFKGTRGDGSRWGLVFDPIYDAANLFDIAKCIPTLRFECESCGQKHYWSHALKAVWNRTGHYVAEVTDKNPAKQSFHWTAIIDWPWEELATEMLSAFNALKQGMLEPLRAFVQKYSADFWTDSIAANMDTRPAQICEPLPDLPPDWIVGMGIDQQQQGIQYGVIRAWGPTGESRRLWFGRMYSTGEARAKQLEFKVPDNCVWKDARYLTQAVAAECCNFGWIAVMGEADLFFIHTKHVAGKTVTIRKSYSPLSRIDPHAGSRQQGTFWAKLVRFSTFSIGQRLDGLKHGKAQLWGRPQPITPEEIADEKEYDRQLAAEYIIKKNGKFIYHCPSGNNHYNDCERILVLFATVRERLPDLLESPKAEPVPA